MFKNRLVDWFVTENEDKDFELILLEDLDIDLSDLIDNELILLEELDIDLSELFDDELILLLE